MKEYPLMEKNLLWISAQKKSRSTHENESCILVVAGLLRYRFELLTGGSKK
jgi:hypothetical protein